MGVEHIAEDWEGRSATTDEDGVQTFTRRWKVRTDADLTAEPAVVDAVVAKDATAGLYAPHPAWPWAVCRKLRARPNKGPRLWFVDADYSSAPFRAAGTGSGVGGGVGGGSTPNPTAPSPQQSNRTPADARPPVITVARKEVTEVLERDEVTYARVLNTAGDPFDPPVEVFRSRHVITFRFFRAPANLNWAARSLFHDSLNDGPVNVLGRVYPALGLRCTDYSLDTVWETGAAGMAFFFALTCQAEFNPKGWQPKILNTGRRKLVAGKPVSIVDDAGQPVADPVPLTAAGAPVAPGGTYHYVEPRGYVPMDWSLLLS